MAFQVQSGVITGSATIQITPVPVGKAYAVISYRGSNDVPPCAAYFQGDGTNWTSLVISAASTNTVAWYVVWGDDFTVQHGTFTLTSDAQTVAISEVDLSSTFAVVSSTGGGSYYGSRLVSIRFASSTSIECSVYDWSASVTVGWFVVSWSGASVQSGLVELNNVLSASVPISEVDLSRSFLVLSRKCARTSAGYAGLAYPEGSFTSSLELTFGRGYNHPFYPTIISFFAVSHPRISVQYGRSSISTSSSSIVVSVTEVPLSDTFSVMSAKTPESAIAAHDFLCCFTNYLTSSTELSITRYSSGAAGTSYASWFVIQSLSVAPTVETNAASSISESGATLNGTLTADGGEACSCSFEWGLDTSYGNTTPTQSKITGQTFAQVISGLSINTQYHYRAKAVNSAGIAYGSDVAFYTLAMTPSSPSVTQIQPTVVTFSWNANGNPFGTYYAPEYRKVGDTSWTTIAETTSTSVNITGLEASQQYEFQVRAKNADNIYTAYTTPVSITLDSTPPIITINSISATRISNQPGKTTCVVVFTVNEDIQAYEIRAGGSGAGQGVLVESGGAVAAGTIIEGYIDYSELTYEGDHEINIYAQDLAGNWTSYHDER